MATRRVDDFESREPRAQTLVDDESVSRALYTDSTIFDTEMERIFRGTWVYIGHESQVAHPGDYITSQLGKHPVILTRDEDGELHLLYNRCLHRGATVCQSAQGNANFFRCLYHGWTYKNNGVLTGVAFPAGYGSRISEFKGQQLGRVEHVSTHYGLIFAHAGEPEQSLSEYLAPAESYIKRFVDSVPGDGVIVSDPPFNYRYKGNWKYQLENAVDGYHPAITHLSFIKVMGERTGNKRNPYQKDTGLVSVKALGNGHSVLDLGKARHRSQRDQDFGDSYIERAKMTPGGNQLVADLEEEFGAEEAVRLLEVDNDFNVAIFPNLMIIQSQIRVLYPVSPTETQIRAWTTIGKGAPPAVNKLRLRMQEVFNGPAGFGSPDDLEMFERCQTGLPAGDRDRIDFIRGLEREKSEGGVRVGQGSDEGPFRGQYAEWKRLMEAAE